RKVVSSSYQFRNVSVAFGLVMSIAGETISFTPGWFGAGEKIELGRVELRCSLGLHSCWPPVAELVQPSGSLDCRSLSKFSSSLYRTSPARRGTVSTTGCCPLVLNEKESVTAPPHATPGETLNMNGRVTADP